MTAAEDDIDDEIIVTLSDYLDGVLPAERNQEVKAKIESDAEWKRTYNEMRETRDHMSGLLKARVDPQKFDQEVTSTIHKRSAGRFFAQRTLGDRVPLGVLLILGLIVIIWIGVMLWSSPTGSLKRTRQSEPQGSGAIVPKP